MDAVGKRVWRWRREPLRRARLASGGHVWLVKVLDAEARGRLKGEELIGAILEAGRRNGLLDG